VRELPGFIQQALATDGQGLSVAVVRLGAMGDVLRTLPSLRRLREALPAAGIHFVVEEKWRAVLEGHPDLDGLLPVPRKLWQQLIRSPAGWPRLAQSVVGFRREARALSFDIALDFQNNLRSGLVTRLTGARVRVGFSGHQQKEGNSLLMTHRLASGRRRVSRIERNLALIGALGIESSLPERAALPLALHGAAEAERVCEKLGWTSQPFAVIAPGASAAQAFKTPPPALLAAAAHRLSENGVRSLVIHGPGEIETAHAVVAASDGAVSLAPPTNLATLTALLARAEMLVGGDSGPLHLACAVGCPVLGLYGPTDPVVNRPWGVPFRTVYPPCREYTGVTREDRRQVFEGLTAAQIEEAADSLLAELRE